ncbi:glutamine synthetase family protein [Palleronia sp. LCG004]|uniref:glutamine synthetase family protein n=1 Tax=Palleronia sp. LCG004 TaxID=3079304 RepID=UPI0029421A39|nr:glutamine synthetase family protein [Palleronia sp. LCG004]WOI57870.1 glutamine synthetase family protein [Palleronia sp. LCG004]
MSDEPSHDPAPDLRNGRLAQLGLLDAAAQQRAGEILETVERAGVETIRVVFADAHGVLRGKTILAKALPSLFKVGLRAPSTLLLKDTSGRTAFPVWSAEGSPVAGTGAGDMLMVPAPETFRILPWAPHSAWLFCDLAFTDGSPIPFAPRQVLKAALSRLASRGWSLTVGLEVEFHLFRSTEPRLAHGDSGMPHRPPETELLAPGYQFLAEGVYDRMEPVLDEMRKAACDLGLPLRSVEIEMGPGQVEFVFDPADALSHADNMIMLRAMAKDLAARRGLHASFMCRPRIDGGASAGWHLHQSLVEMATGRNLFVPETEQTLTPEASGWIAGLLAHAEASCILTTPTVNGYKRYQPFQMAPDRVQWGRDNRGAMIRALMEPGDGASRIENRVAEPAANPYYVFAAQILSGLDGIDRGLDAGPPAESPYTSGAPRLPRSLADALTAFHASSLYRTELGPEFAEFIVTLKQAEWDRYATAVSDWEQREYFGLL